MNSETALATVDECSGANEAETLVHFPGAGFPVSCLTSFIARSGTESGLMAYVQNRLGPSC